MYKTSDELRKLQFKCLEILEVVDWICRRNNIQYSLCGGSVVGAYLYQGFIPWDDDIDLMMTRENYERFIVACRKELPAKYKLQNYKTEKIYHTLFSKVVDTDTTLVQYDNNGKEVVNGVFLDITVYDKVPQNCIKKIDFAISNFAQKLIYCDVNAGKGLKKRILSLFGNHCSCIYILCEKIFCVLGKIGDYSYCELFGAFCTNKLYKKSIFEEYAEIGFENKKFMIVKDYVDYLECRYERTNFYEPESRQVPPHYAYVDLMNSYKEYQRKQNENSICK